MPVKHGPKNVDGKVTVDRTCIYPGCKEEAMKGLPMCRDHEPTEDMRSPKTDKES